MKRKAITVTVSARAIHIEASSREVLNALVKGISDKARQFQWEVLNGTDPFAIKPKKAKVRVVEKAAGGE